MAGDREPITLKSFSAAQPSGRTGNGSETFKADMLKLDGKPSNEGKRGRNDSWKDGKLFTMLDAKETPRLNLLTI